MIVATAAGVESNLELTVPIIVIGLVLIFIWNDLVATLSRALDEADDGPLLRAVHGSRPTGGVERRPEDRERARQERAVARLSRQLTEGTGS